VPKAVYRSGCRDKHSRPRCDWNLGPLASRSDALTTRPLRPVFILHRVFEIYELFIESRRFSSTLHAFVAHVGVKPLKFHPDVWQPWAIVWRCRQCSGIRISRFFRFQKNVTLRFLN